MRYSALHCGQATRAVLLPRCFSSTQRCRQAWWTHLVEPRQRHGRTHSAVRSSSSVAKHTQQLLEQTPTPRWDKTIEQTHKTGNSCAQNQSLTVHRLQGVMQRSVYWDEAPLHLTTMIKSEVAEPCVQASVWVRETASEINVIFTSLLKQQRAVGNRNSLRTMSTISA